MLAATIFEIIGYLISVIVMLVIVQFVMSLLISFNVINMQNGFVRSVVTGLDRFFDPMLRPIRRILPDMGGIDLAPMVLILLIMLVQRGLPAILLDTGLIGAG